MTEAIGIQGLFLSTISGAVIVLTGAFYALFFALGRMHESRALTAAGLVAYAVLVVAVAVLVLSLDLEGIWLAVAGVLLMGYFLAPRAIWRLCIGTHRGELAGRNKGAAR